jgi:hypothetical protein
MIDDFDISKSRLKERKRQFLVVKGQKVVMNADEINRMNRV